MKFQEQRSLLKGSHPKTRLVPISGRGVSWRPGHGFQRAEYPGVLHVRSTVESTHWAHPESVAPDNALRYRLRFDFNDRVPQISARNQVFLLEVGMERSIKVGYHVYPRIADEDFVSSITGD